MKRIIFISGIIFICIKLYSQERKVISDCTITFSVVNVSESEQNDFGSKTIFIKGKDIRTDLVTSGYSQTVFYNSNNEEATVLKIIGDAKYILQYNASEWDKANSIFDSIAVSLTNETKDILNYACKQAVLTLKNGNKYIVYYAPELMPSVIERPFESKNIPGLVLEYEFSTTKDEKIVYTATKVDFNPVPSFQYEIPKKDYRILH